MHELRRRSFLQQLGIDTYISRSQQPGAASTQRLLVKRQPPADLGPAQVKTDPQNIALTPVARTAPFTDIASKLSPSPKKQPAREADVQTDPDKKGAVKPLEPFSVTAMVSGHWLWLEELPHGVLSRDQVHLVQAMARALGVAEAKCNTSQFDWPIHNNSQLDLGVEAARAGLAGFVQRRLEQFECRGLVVLGRACQGRLAIQQLRVQRCVSTRSTAEMLVAPQLKKQVWRDLLPLIGPS